MIEVEGICIITLTHHAIDIYCATGFAKCSEAFEHITAVPHEATPSNRLTQHHAVSKMQTPWGAVLFNAPASRWTSIMMTCRIHTLFPSSLLSTGGIRWRLLKHPMAAVVERQ